MGILPTPLQTPFEKGFDPENFAIWHLSVPWVGQSRRKCAACMASLAVPGMPRFDWSPASAPGSGAKSHRPFRRRGTAKNFRRFTSSVTISLRDGDTFSQGRRQRTIFRLAPSLLRQEKGDRLRWMRSRSDVLDRLRWMRSRSDIWDRLRWMRSRSDAWDRLRWMRSRSDAWDRLRWMRSAEGDFFLRSRISPIPEG